MVKDHSDSEKGNPVPPDRLLLSINSKGSFICTIPQTGQHIPRPLLHQSWSTGRNEKSYHNKINQCECVHGNSPQVHHPEHVDDDEDDGDDDDDGCVDLESKQDDGHNEDGENGQRQIDEAIPNYRQVLFVEHVENAAEMDKKVCRTRRICCRNG